MSKLWAIPIVGTILAIIGLATPIGGSIMSGGGYTVTMLLWSFGTLFIDASGISATINLADLSSDFLTVGMINILLLIIGAVLMILPILTKFDKISAKLGGVLALIGGVLALIAPIIYYVMTSAAVLNIWTLFGLIPSVGFFLSIIAGAVGILGGVLLIVKG